MTVITVITMIVLILFFLNPTVGLSTPGPTIPTTTINPCEVEHGCLNDASCNGDGDCFCKLGFTGTQCEQSALEELSTRVMSSVTSSNLNQASNFAAEAKEMMDNQLKTSYNGMKTSVETTNLITSGLIALITNTDTMNDEATVDLLGLTTDITEMATDVLQGTKQAESSMTQDQLKLAVTQAENNLLSMTNIMLNKRSTDNPESAAIDTADISVRVMKQTGSNLPVEYSGRDGGFNLPFYETFQDRERKKNVSINVVAYKESPYLHVNNPESIASSVIKLQVKDQNDHIKKKIKDNDDPMDIFLGSGSNDDQSTFEDMTESQSETGVYISFIDTNQTAAGLMVEIKLTSLKICDIYGRFNGYPDEFDFDFWVQTKGKSRVKDKQPLELPVTFKEQILKLTIPGDKEGDSNTYKPVYITASCEDDRADTAKQRKKRSGLSLVRHQFRARMLNVKTLNEAGDKWKNDKDLKDVGVDGQGRIKFKSNFFGTFAADMFFIGPAPIDFSALFANFAASIAETPHALAAIVSIIVLFAFLTVPLRRLDRGDELMWSYLPLVGDNKSDLVTYLIAVETSVTSPKTIKSSVYINIIGKEGQSGTRKLEDGERKNFTRGTSSHFLMRLNKDLGELESVQVWHDNIDGKTAWHLGKITVIKTDSAERYTFLCGKWLSINSDDGKTWRILEALDADHITTDTLFFSLSQKKIFDDHLWVSLFKRPQFSRFTRVQRLWCLVALLFLAMISSAMWYETPEDKGMPTISLGPLKLNYKQFYVGLMSSCIALVPSLILVLIFRNRKFKGEPTVGCHMPWWSIFFAYFLVFACVGASATFVFLYSLQWGRTKTLEWMVSFVLAIFQSIIVLEPVKAIILAILVACFFKKVGSKELTNKGMVVPTSAHDQSDDIEKADVVDSKPVEYPAFPGTQGETDEEVVARINAQTDKRMWSKFKLWLGILGYVILVALISSHSNVSTAFLQNNHILETLSTVYVPNSTDEIYDWIRGPFTRAVYPKWWETEDDDMLRPAYIQWFILNAYNYRITMTRLRQVRVKGNCSVPEITSNTLEKCTPSYNSKTEEKEHFCPFWETLNATETGCFDENEEIHYAFHQNFGENKNGGDLPYTGQHGTYSPDGYYVDLGPKQSLVLSYVTKLQNLNWIDERTRAVFLDVVTFNANTRLFSGIKVVFEIPSIGGITMTTSVWSANLYPYVYAIDYLVLLLQVIYVIVWLVRFVLLIVNICKNRTKVLVTISFYLRLMELILGGAAIVCFILRIDATVTVIDSLKMTIGRYTSFEKIIVYDTAYRCCLAGVLFIITLDLLKPLEFNYHFFMLTSALKIAKTSIFAFMLIILIELIAFACLLHLTIGYSHELFRDMPESMNTLLTVLLGMMSYTSEHFSKFVTKLYFGLYTLTVTITLVNVFIVILTIAFNDVKTELEKGKLHYDEKLNVHFWNKVHNGFRWLQERFCFSCISDNSSEISKLYGHTRRLGHITQKIERDERKQNQMIAKLLINMIEIDSKITKLQCIDVQRNQFSTKYIFGFQATGERVLVLNVPTLSSTSEIKVECYLVPRLRREVRKKFKHSISQKLVGNAFSLFTDHHDMIKGSVQIEVIDSNDRYSTHNTLVMKTANASDWIQLSTHKSETGVVSSVATVPLHIATIETDINSTEEGEWNPVETYVVSKEGGTVFPSYNEEARITFPENSFDDLCAVSLKTKDGSFTSVMNIDLEVPTQKPIDVELPLLTTADYGDNLANLIISVRRGEINDWERLNSVLKRDKDSFHFTYLPTHDCTNVDFTVQKWKINEVIKNSEVKTKNDSDLMKAFVMVSKVPEIARQWRDLAGTLGIAECEIGEEKDNLCKEEKCFMVLKKWQEKTTVNLPMLTLFLTSVGFRLTAEHIRKKWIVNSPEQILKEKNKPLNKSKSQGRLQIPNDNAAS